MLDQAARTCGAESRRCSSSMRCTGSPRPSRTCCCRGRERLVTLIAATTENPSFSVISPLLSRSLLLTLRPLTDDDVSLAWTGHWPRTAVSAGGTPWTMRPRHDPAPRRRRRPPGTDLPGGGRRGGVGRRGHRDHHRDRGGCGGQGGHPLRPRRRPALRRDQRLHQVDPRLRRAGRAALPGQNDRGGEDRGFSRGGW